MRVLDVSKNTVGFTGKCKMRVSVPERESEVTIRFLADLPTGMQGLIGRDILTPLDMVLSPAARTLPTASIKTPTGLRPVRWLKLEPVCDITETAASALAIIPHADFHPSVFVDTMDVPIDQQLSEEGSLFIAGYTYIGNMYPAALKTVDLVCFSTAAEADFVNSDSPKVISTYAAIKALCDNIIDLESEQKKTLYELCIKYESVFNTGDKPLGKTDLAQFTINLKDYSKPRSCPPRKVSPAKRQEIARIVQKCLDQGVVVPSTSEWASAVVLIRKPNGEGRLCVDYRPLNAITRIPIYPLPRIEQALECLQGKTYYSTFDLLNAFWQIEIHPGARKYLAFITPDGLYEWTRMPFGVSGAPATQQRLIDALLAGIKWVSAIAYMDDIIVFSETFEDHLRHLEILFSRCRKHKLQLNPKKSALCRAQIKYLGVIVSHQGVQRDPIKTQPIREIPPPTNRRQLRRFLGMGSYYRRFIKNYARLAAPLQKLLPENVPFEWGPQQQNAFNAIKEALVSPTLMLHPKPGLPFIIDCDAAAEGLGAVLQQLENGAERPIAYASRSLRPNKKKWHTTELEAYAVVWALETFRHYIEGSPILVRTDHSPLLWLRKNAGKSTISELGFLRLQDFALELQHCPGKAKVVADALSRVPLQKKDHNIHTDIISTPTVAFIKEAER